MAASSRSQAGANFAWYMRILSGLPRPFAANTQSVTATPLD